MPSFGQKLKAEREKRSITLDQISLTTKIGTRMLQALEEDKFSQLPGGIFNKGFVRAYARCIGIDEDQAVSDYLVAAGEPAPTNVETPGEASAAPSRNERKIEAPVEPQAGSSSRQLPWGMFAALLLLVAVALSVWTHRKHEAAQVSTAAPASSASPSSPPSDSDGNIDKRKSEMTTPSVAADHSATVVPAKETASKNLETALGAAIPQASPAQPGEFTVVIQGREDCWISITADSKTIASYLLPAGQQRLARAKQSVIIKAGNAGGLDLLFNGKKVGVQASSGEVKTLIFGPDGLEASSTAPQSAQ